jgi:putative addiction module component (TIGR02574 family)
MMGISREEVFRAACELPVYDRNQLAGLLYDSLPDEEEVEEAVAVEAHRRWLDLERGEVEGIPGEQVIETLRARRNRLTAVVLLDRDVAVVFPDQDSVNRALRALAQIINEHATGATREKGDG